MAGEDNLNQDDIEQLLAGKNAGGDKEASAESSPSSEAAVSASGPSKEQTLNQDDIEAVLKGAQKGQDPGEGDGPAPEAAAQSDDGKILGDSEIENLLKSAVPQGGSAASSALPTVEASAKEPVSSNAKNLFPEDGSINENDVEYLLNQAEQAINSIRDGGSNKLPAGIQQFNFEHFGGTTASGEMATLDLIKDVDLDLRIELGRTHMYLQDVLKLRSGSVVPLDKLAGDPVDIFVNGRLIAKGEVLVLNDNFCVRIGELIAGAEAAG